jgi:hypothetical protein
MAKRTPRSRNRLLLQFNLALQLCNLHRPHNPLVTRFTCISRPTVFVLFPLLVQLDRAPNRTRPMPTDDVDMMVFRIMITELNIISGMLTSMFQVP